MTRILLLTPQVPYPPRQGTSLRNFHIMRGLAQSHDITLLSFQANDQSVDSDSIGPILELSNGAQFVPVDERGQLTRFIRLFGNQRPDMSHRLQSARFDVALRELLSGAGVEPAGRPGFFDVVQIEGIELARTIPIIRQLAPAARIVFDDHNAETELQRRNMRADLTSPGRWAAAVYSWIQSERLRQYERWACLEADWVVAVSEIDRAHLKHLAPSSPITVIPNCVDVSEYQNSDHDAGKSFDLVFSGKMDYRPNVDAVLWFVRRVWPIIRKQRPVTTLAIVGQRPHSRLDGLAQVAGITVTGFVDDVKPYLSGAKVYVMPFQVGSGTRLKLIEAMASGVAVVSTTVGIEGFSVKNELELLIADDPKSFAGSVLHLLKHPEARAQYVVKAKEFARQYDWRYVIPKFEDVYGRLGV